MDNKQLALLIYALVGGLVAFVCPILWRARLFQNHNSSPFVQLREPAWLSDIMAVIALIVLVLERHYLRTNYIAGCLGICVIVAALLKGEAMRFLPAMFLALLITAILPWWKYMYIHLWLDDFETLQFVALSGMAYWLLEMKAHAPPILPNKFGLVALWCAFALAAFYFSFTTGIVIGDVLSVWHHWGAYVGPAQLVAVGAHPLSDIPMQYGLGPTLILALFGAENCWLALYWLAGSMTFVMAFVLANIALHFNRARDLCSIGATLAITCATLLWTAFPAALHTGLATPSTGGIRFLPGLLMLWFLLRQDGSKIWCGHLLWLGCLFWSPESGFFASALWLPYLIWSRCLAQNSVRIFAKTIAELVVVLAVGVGIFALGYNLLLHDWPSFIEYIIYMIYPPGPMPVNIYGTVWFAISASVLWFAAMGFLKGEGGTTARRYAWLAMLFALAAFSYYLGRSHDNNILNLLPALALLLFAVRSIAPQGAVRATSTMLLASLLGWVMMFGMNNFAKASTAHRLFDFYPRQLVQIFNREHGVALADDPAMGLTDKAIVEFRAVDEALAKLRAEGAQNIEIYDRHVMLDSGAFNLPWNAIHGPENFAFMPSERRQAYLQRVMKRLNKPGWVLYDKDYDFNEFLRDLDAVYQRGQERDFGKYKAIEYKPR